MHTKQHTNPLFDSHCRVLQPSPTREHPQPEESPVGVKIKHRHAGRRFCLGCQQVPWIAVLCAAVAAGALVVWDVYTNRLVTALMAVLSHIKVPETLLPQVSAVVRTVQTALVAAVSAVTGLLLLAAILRKQQVCRKRKALTLSDWPQGWRTICCMVLTVLLLVVLWVLSAAFVCLLCMSVTTTGLALLADLGAGKAAEITVGVTTAANSAITQAASAVLQANDAFTMQMAKAPASVQSAPWISSLNSTVGPLLRNAARSAEGNKNCPPNCLDLTFLASAIPRADVHTMDTCICSQEKVLELQALVHTMWQTGVASCIGLAVMLAIGSFMLMHGVADCVSAYRDHQDATFFQREYQHTHQRNSRIRSWVNSSSAHSFDIKADQRRQEQLLAPELPASLSPKKQVVQEWSAAAADVCLPPDIEQPAPHNDQQASLSEDDGPTDTLSPQPSYVRHTSASTARQTDSLRTSARQTDTTRSTTSANSSVQRTRKRWQ